MPRVLFAGESWVVAETHIKGFDAFVNTRYDSAFHLIKPTIEAAGCSVDWIKSQDVATDFPYDAESLAAYDLVMISDVGASSFLLHPDVWHKAKPGKNRLLMLRDWVVADGSVAVFGGYMSFAGIAGQARFHRTPLEDVLPVDVLPYDDRVETPEGARPRPTEVSHPILSGLGEHWEPLLGYNRLTAKPEAQVLLEIGPDPLLAVREIGRGRSLTWSSDIGPHWCPAEFSGSTNYRVLMTAAVRWLTRTD